MKARDEMMPDEVKCPDCGQTVKSFGQKHDDSNCQSFKAGQEDASSKLRPRIEQIGQRVAFLEKNVNRAEKQGMQKVVDWIEEHNENAPFSSTRNRLVKYKGWQSFLKENGLRK